jgi:hypothetical protein
MSNWNKLIPRMEVKCDSKDILRCMTHVHVHSIHVNMDGWYT